MAEQVEIADIPQHAAPARLDPVRFTRLLYTKLLEREPQAGELVSWVQGMAGGLAADEVLARFVASEEFRRVRAAGRPDPARFAELLYPAVLNRAGQPEEIEGWRRGLEAGLPADEMLAQFLASEEFQRLRAAEQERARECLAASYRSVSQCAPEPEDLAAWEQDLRAGAPFAEVLERVMARAQDQRRASEAAAARRFVALLYEELLARAADEAELESWLRGIQHGDTPDQVLQRFRQSEEYQRRRTAGQVDAADARRFVAGLYDALLHREPTADELEAWAGGVLGGQRPGEVLQRFVDSEEFKGAREAERSEQIRRRDSETAAARRFVALLYEELLARAADEAELESWVRGMQHGDTPDQVLQRFLQSGEYQQRKAAGQVDAADARRFVAGLYAALLEREPTPEELEAWAGGVVGGQRPGEVLQRFLASEEYTGPREAERAQELQRRTAGAAAASRFVALLYEELLARAPAEAELESWIRGIQHGDTPDQVLERFLQSGEYQGRKAAARVDAADARRFVSSLYAALLHRDPAPDELEAWAGGVVGGQRPGDVLQRFLASDEYQGARAARRSQEIRFVQSLFMQLLGREPTEAELTGWAGSIQAGMPLDEVLAGFTGSEEYRKTRREGAPLFVPPGHFYSPVVDPESVRSAFERRPAAAQPVLHGIDMNAQSQLATWRRIAPHLARLPFPEEKTEGFRYWFRNQAYGIGDASVYFGLLLELRPRRIIEIGSGFSSACALDTIDRFFEHEVEIDFVEPYPALLESLVGDPGRNTIRIHAQGVQEVDLALFDRLEEGDILFIDSTHVLKTRSDVHCELFEILPRLRKGVVVHIHDMFWPFEYPRGWVVDQNRSWNELYAVRAFLMYQDCFEILFFNDYFGSTFPDEVKATHPAFLKNTGGALWLRKVR